MSFKIYYKPRNIFFFAIFGIPGSWLFQMRFREKPKNKDSNIITVNSFMQFRSKNLDTLPILFAL